MRYSVSVPVLAQTCLKMEDYSSPAAQEAVNTGVVFWHSIGNLSGMRKWLVTGVNVLLGGFVILLWGLKMKQGSRNFDVVMEQYVPRILLSFTVLTFLILMFSMTRNSRKP